jgi:hypothetical protein
VAAGSALREGLLTDVLPAARARLAAAHIPLFGSDAAVWTTEIAQLPRDHAIEVLACRLQQALIAGPRQPTIPTQPSP